jgi:hypothetical protein
MSTQELPLTAAPVETPSAALAVPPAPIPGETRPSRISIEQLAMLGPMAADDRRIAWVNALVDADIARQSYATDIALARQFAICGQFDELKKQTTEQAIATAMVKIQLGRAWGFNSADAMRNIYFVNGRPALEQDIVASKLQAAGIVWEPEFAFEEVKTDGGYPWQKCVGCTLWLKTWHSVEQRYVPMMNRAGEQISVSFTLGDAQNAKYWENGKEKPLAEKFNYKSYPSDMYYWRCISRVRKYYAPGVLRGGVLKEEALEMAPVSAMQPEMVPPEWQPQVEAAAPPKPTVRDRVLSQPSFFSEPTELETDPK